MWSAFSLYLALGACAGLLSGLFGIGGGIILVPFLAWLFAAQGGPADTVMLMAVATSLATIIFTALSSVSAHHRMAAVLWPIVYRLVPGIVLGSAVGALLADRMPAEMLQTVFAGYLLIVALQMGLQIQPKPDKVKFSNRLMFTAGGLIGTLSSLLGIGGGTLTVPFLTKCRIPMRNAVAISSACGLPIAVAGTISYVGLGWQASPLPKGCLGFIYLPAFVGIVASSVVFAPLGAKLAHHLPTQRLKRLFSLFLVTVACKMVWPAV